MKLEIYVILSALTLQATACQRDRTAELPDAAPARYSTIDHAAALLGQEYSLAVLIGPIDAQAGVESWRWVDEFAAALDIVPPPRDCALGLSICLGYARERLGAELGVVFGVRTQNLYEIMMDTALVAVALIQEKPGEALAFCRHIADRAPITEIPDAPWHTLCDMTPTAGADAILDQLVASRSAIVSWIEGRVDTAAPHRSMPLDGMNGASAGLDGLN